MSTPTIEELATELSSSLGYDLASGRLRFLSTCLNCDLEDQFAAPTAAAERTAMRVAAKQLRVASNALAALSNGTRSAIMGTLAQAKQTERGAAIIYDAAAGQIVLNVPVLQALADALDTAREPIAAAATKRQPGNLHIRLHGHPLQVLASGCVQLLRDAGHKPNTTMIINVMLIVWRHATGKPARRKAMHRYAQDALAMR